MKKAIITTSLLALFAGAAMANSIHGGVTGTVSSDTTLSGTYSDLNLVAKNDDDKSECSRVYGGVAYFTSGGNYYIEKSTFKDISAYGMYQVQGGAVSIDSSTLTIKDSLFRI